MAFLSVWLGTGGGERKIDHCLQKGKSRPTWSCLAFLFCTTTGKMLPSCPGRGAEQEEQKKTWRYAIFPSYLGTSCARFASQRKRIAVPAPQKSEFIGETSLSEHLHGQREGCTLKVLFFTAYLIGHGNKIKGFHLSQARDLCSQIAIAFVISLMHSA